MRIGLYFDLRNPPAWRRDWRRVYAHTLDLCEAADRLGGHSVWFTEHHMYEDGYLPQPLTMAAAVAARTSSVRIGTSVLIAPLRAAAQIAEDAAIVDILSNGRLDLGLGAGYSRPEFKLYQMDPTRRSSALFDRIRDLRRIWRDGEVLPPPVQDPLPIWGGCTGHRSVFELGRMGERLLRAEPEFVSRYLEGIDAGGHDRMQAAAAGPANVFLSDDPERDWPHIAPRLAWQRDTYNRHGLAGAEIPPPVDPEEWRRNGLAESFTRTGFLLATPEEAAVVLRERTRGYAIDNIHIWATLPGVDERLAERNVELAVTRLDPLVRDSS